MAQVRAARVRSRRPRWPALILLSAALLAGAQKTEPGQAGPPQPGQTQAGQPRLNLPTTSQLLQQLQRELEQQRRLSTQQRQDLEQLRARIQNLTAQQRQALGRLDTLADQVAGLENETATLGARVVLAQRQLADTTAQRGVTQARVTRLQGDVRELLGALYRERSGRYLQLLSQARSLSDLLIRLKYANIAGQHNVEVIETLRREVQTLETQRTEQARRTANLQTLQEQRVTKLTQLRDRRAEQGRLLAQLKRSEQGQRTLAARTQAQQVLTAQAIDQLVGQVVQERARIEAERQRRLEEERKRREAELRRIREAQERARQEALRLARIRAEQERQARIAQERARAAAEARARAVAQAKAEAQARAQAQAAAQAAAARQAALTAQRQRQVQLQQEQTALRARETQVQQAAVRVQQQLAPLPAVSGPVGFPLPGGSVTQPYGANGAQWSVLQGTEDGQAVAALDGNVIATTYYASLGWVVLLDHGPTVTAYFGLQDAQVAVGERVARGTPLGTVGGSPIFGPGRMAFQVNSVSGGSRRPVPPPF
ncbi:peptidase M23B [Deinococcus phoenicis]|uniref:Peptidase M23B n=1 Tax=Deinococcus phoenicis TaxID=1476583 RepID=A0A016QLH0_9DEIO|nr:M23 family metallopeptidase [Deinococcus phoenicis]EYB66604.1 peptidase M23B [Deinococcus phoenicis]